MSQERCSDRGKGRGGTVGRGVSGSGWSFPLSRKNTVRQEGEDEGRVVKESRKRKGRRKEAWITAVTSVLIRHFTLSVQILIQAKLPYVIILNNISESKYSRFQRANFDSMCEIDAAEPDISSFFILCILLCCQNLHNPKMTANSYATSGQCSLEPLFCSYIGLVLSNPTPAGFFHFQTLSLRLKWHHLRQMSCSFLWSHKI